MIHRLPTLMLAGIVTVMLAGCAGGLGALLGLIAVGDVIGNVQDLIGGDEPGDFDVYLDGQLLPVTPASNGSLRLQGLPEGEHLLQVIAPSRERGAVAIIDVNPNSDLRLDNLEPEVGGRIRGQVTLQETGGATHVAARVPVYAVPGGAQAVAPGQTPVAIPPAGLHYVAFTDGNGNFSLDAVAPGDYLVTTAVAGYDTDVQLVTGLGERETEGNMDLALVVDGTATGAVQGTVSGQATGGTQSLAGAGLRAEPPTPIRPEVPQATLDRIADDSGTTPAASPWFEWRVLSTLSNGAGGYALDLPVGTSRLTCFAYNYRPGYLDLTVTDGATTRADFTLDRN